MDQQQPLTDPRTKSVLAAVLVGGAIFLGWFFLLPHRVPEDTHNDLSSSAQDLQANVSDIVDRTQEARSQLDAEIEAERQQVQEEQEEAERLQESLNASREDLEAQGHTTTVEPTE